jgi:hypothetical protein
VRINFLVDCFVITPILMRFPSVRAAQEHLHTVAPAPPRYDRQRFQSRRINDTGFSDNHAGNAKSMTGGNDKVDDGVSTVLSAHYPTLA